MADLHHHNTNNNGGRDWSSLPSDVLTNIADNFLPLPDYILFRSVCKSWCNSVPPVIMPLPLLLLPTNGSDFSDHTADSLTFCSPASPETTFDSPVPPGVTGTHCVGSHDGWLAMWGPALNLFLFNPFTADRIDLPAFTTLVGFNELYDADEDAFSYSYPEMAQKIELGCCYIKKIVFNSSPTTENLMAMAIHTFGGLAYTRAGEEKWNSYGGEDYGENSELFIISGFHDVVFHDSRFWAIHDNGTLSSFDIRGKGLPKISTTFDMFDIGFVDDFYEDVKLGVDDKLLYGDDDFYEDVKLGVDDKLLYGDDDFDEDVELGVDDRLLYGDDDFYEDVELSLDDRLMYGDNDFSEDAELGVDDRLLHSDKYLAVDNAGNIFMVFRDRGEDGTKLNTRRVVVIEFIGPDFDRGCRVRNLGSLSLFVGNNNGFCLPMEVGQQLRGNCVFITDILRGMRHGVYDMGVFDMGNKSFELIFPQRTEFNWCQLKPVWFTPSLKQNNLESTFSTLSM